MPKLPRRLYPNDEIFGLPAARIRDVMRRIHRNEGQFTIAWLAWLLKTDLVTATTVTTQMVAQGYAQEWEDAGRRDSDVLVLSAQGSALAKMHFRPWLSRSKADAIVARVRDAIDAVNDDESYLYSIQYACLFGSYVNSDDPEVPDIDVAIHTAPRDRLSRLSQAERDALFKDYARRHKQHFSVDGAIMGPWAFAADHPIGTIKRAFRQLDLTTLDDAVFLQEYLNGTVRALYTMPGAKPLKTYIETTKTWALDAVKRQMG